MSWRTAFLHQAASDDAVRQLLARQGAPACHRLHYLQMSSEKLAKGLLHSPVDVDPPVQTHVAFVRLLQLIKTSRGYRRLLGYSDSRSFKAYLESMLVLATRIQELAPAVAGAGRSNAEYPWSDMGADAIVAPVDFDFPGFDPRDPGMIKLDRLLRSPLRISF